jgi:hypothetical protein
MRPHVTQKYLRQYVTLTTDPEEEARQRFTYKVVNHSEKPYVCLIESHQGRGSTLSKLSAILRGSQRAGKSAYAGHVVPARGQLYLKGEVELKKITPLSTQVVWLDRPSNKQELHQITLQVTMVRLGTGNVLSGTHYVAPVTLHAMMPAQLDTHEYRVHIHIPEADFSVPIQAPEVFPSIILPDILPAQAFLGTDPVNQ